MILAFRILFFIAFCNDLLFGDTPHLGENLADSFINDLIQNVDGISRLPGAVGLLAELSVTGLAGARRSGGRAGGRGSPFTAAGQFQLCSAVSAVSVAGKQRLPMDVQRKTIFGFRS